MTLHAITNRRLIAAFSVLGCLFSLACAPKANRLLLVPEAAPPQIGLLALYPLQFKHAASKAEQLRTTHVILDTMLASSAVPIVCPWEFQHLGRNSSSQQKTDLLLLTTREGHRSDQTVYLTLSIEKRVAQSGAHMETTQGAVAGRASSYEAHYEAQAQLEDMHSGKLIAQWRILLKEDPFAETPPHDPHPTLRKALSMVLMPALQWVNSRVATARTTHDITLWQANLFDVLSAAPPLNPSNLMELNQALTRLSYIRPAITTKEISQAFALGHVHVCLKSNPGPIPATFGHSPGTCIKRIDGNPIRHPAQLYRILTAPRAAGHQELSTP